MHATGNRFDNDFGYKESGLEKKESRAGLGSGSVSGEYGGRGRGRGKSLNNMAQARFELYHTFLLTSLRLFLLSRVA